ncbi:MAG: cold shock domain-containing protein, partial [Lentisphaeria bacterium]|nr:cold shock domain-containing protein [Lentisphaeria bacterium]
YGFIERESGGDIFLHYSSIKVDGYRTVKEGQEVEFIVTNGTKGLQADEVVPLN